MNPQRKTMLMLAVLVLAAALGTSAASAQRIDCGDGETLYYKKKPVGCLFRVAQGRDYAAQQCAAGTLLPEGAQDDPAEIGCFICLHRDQADLGAKLAPGPSPIGFIPSVGCLQHFTPNDSRKYRRWLKKREKPKSLIAMSCGR